MRGAQQCVATLSPITTAHLSLSLPSSLFALDHGDKTSFCSARVALPSRVEQGICGLQWGGAVAGVEQGGPGEDAPRGWMLSVPRCLCRRWGRARQDPLADSLMHDKHTYRHAKPRREKRATPVQAELASLVVDRRREREKRARAWERVNLLPGASCMLAVHL